MGIVSGRAIIPFLSGSTGFCGVLHGSAGFVRQGSFGTGSFCRLRSAGRTHEARNP